MKRLGALLLAVLLVLSACDSPADEWQEQYDLGVRYLTEGNYEEAILAFRAAIEIDEKRTEAWLGLADVYEAQGDLEQAAAALQDALERIGEDESLRERLETVQQTMEEQEQEEEENREEPPEPEEEETPEPGGEENREEPPEPDEEEEEEPPEPPQEEEPEEPAADDAYRTAMLTALDDIDNPDRRIYGRLIDVSGDGLEDLLVLDNVDSSTGATGVPSWTFSAYIWNGAEAVKHSFTEEYFIGLMGFQVCRQKDTGKIYVCYEGSLDAVTTWTYESMDDTVRFEQDEHEDPSMGNEPAYSMTASDGTARELTAEEFEAGMGQFEQVEDLEELGNHGDGNLIDWVLWLQGNSDRPASPPCQASLEETRAELQEG